MSTSDLERPVEAAPEAGRPTVRKPGIPQWMAPYVEAAWGLRNHWYPAAFSDEVREDDVKGIQLGGEYILLRRSRGKVYALKDECVHRGVRISRQPTCLTKDTVSCWYHGFTYNLTDGKLHSIVACPDDSLIGRVGIRTFKVQETNGMIFVFLGDEGYEPPALAHDLPPRPADDYEHKTGYLLDSSTVVRGIHRNCVGNWRLAAESGPDPGHVLIHRNSALILALDIGLALGERRSGPDSIVTDDKSWPKGVAKNYDKMEFVMENKALNIRSRGSNHPRAVRVSLYLPGVLFVENWPQYGLAQYEWYVPVDDHHHEYWQVLTKICATDEEREEFEVKYRHSWEELALREFNDDDIWSRDAMEHFYADNKRGWEQERLFSMDEFTVLWRRLVSRHHRGIQPPPGTFPAGR